MQAVQAEGRQGWDWAGFGWLFLFFWYFSGVAHLLIQLTGTTGFESFRQAFLMSAFWIIPVLLFPRQARVITGSIGLLLWGVILTTLVVLAMLLPLSLGLLVVGPWLGHASWHAYRGAVEWPEDGTVAPSN